MSLQRLTVGVTSSFFYAPWNDLNDSFGAVRDAYAYNAVLGLQSGSIDRHRGDISAGLDVMYRLVGPISFVVEASRSFSRADMTLRTVASHAVPGLAPVPRSFDNSFDLQVTGIGAGMLIDVSSTLRTRVRLSVGHAEANLDYAYSLVNDFNVYRLNASLADQTTYIALGVEGSIPIAGPLSLTIGAAYRSVRFSRLEGDGTMMRDFPASPGYAATIPFRARLVKAGSYYGIDPSGDWRLEIGEQALVTPWLSTPGTSDDALSTSASPTILYLSGFGIRGGLTYAF